MVRLTSFKKREDGNATIEFVFLFPAFMFLFLTGFESGYYMVRNVMLERAVDVAVRDVRLGNGSVPRFEKLKERICEQASIIPDCVNSVQIEMQSVAITPGSTTAVNGPVRCVDRLSEEDPETGTIYDAGNENELMIVRVCALSQPLFPTTRLGVGMKVDVEGNYAIVATSGFVNEPGNRDFWKQGDNGFGNGDQDAPGESLDYNEAENDTTADTTGNGSGNGNGQTTPPSQPNNGT